MMALPLRIRMVCPVAARSWAARLRARCSLLIRGLVVVGAEVVELGVGVGEEVVDDREHPIAGGHDGLLLAAAVGKAPVAGAEEGVGAGGAGLDDWPWPSDR